ncbi:unnamed protein product [Nezara viridula]|uniref:Uncharacterized protein n=1 Tax=Nezara viridula TaxID=85310 RepID=A0A9P0E3V9_NEZVI|nr:unnamed protein product [Nezara viridula]
MVSKPNRSNKKQRDLSEKVKAIDAELMSFYEFCEKMGFTQEEMDTICSPLKEVMSKHSMARLAKGLLAILLIFGVIYCATHVGPLATHTTAVGRIAMIKVLSFWDWQHLFHEQCLIENPLYGEYGLTHEDCMTCEALDTIHVISRTSYKVLSDNYFNREAPVIISDATDSWEVMNNDLHFDNITQLYLDDEKLTESVPCVLTTNLRQGGPDLMSFLKMISNSSIKKWFVHWQNCDIHAVKVLRRFYQKPYFLPNTISPAHFNWVFMSSDYSSRNYKKIELDFGLIMLIQLRGNTSVRLLPYRPCNDSCSDLSATLHQGEILVLKNYLWTLEYLPGHGLDNIAILTETAWDQSSV